MERSNSHLRRKLEDPISSSFQFLGRKKVKTEHLKTALAAKDASEKSVDLKILLSANDNCNQQASPSNNIYPKDRSNKGDSEIKHEDTSSPQEEVDKALETTEKEKNNALVSATSRGDLERARLLLGEGAYVNFSWGLPLWSASNHGHQELVQLLVDNGAEVNLNRNEELTTALCAASEIGHYGIVELLLKYGADPNLNDGLALGNAYTFGHKDVAQLLLKHGADINLESSKPFEGSLDKPADIRDQGDLPPQIDSSRIEKQPFSHHGIEQVKDIEKAFWHPKGRSQGVQRTISEDQTDEIKVAQMKLILALKDRRQNNANLPMKMINGTSSSPRATRTEDASVVATQTSSLWK